MITLEWDDVLEKLGNNYKVINSNDIETEHKKKSSLVLEVQVKN